MSIVACFSGGSLADITIPPKFKKIIGDYRKNLVRVSGLESSPLHWGHGIVIYCNSKAVKTYRHNHFEYVKEFEMDEDDDEEEEIKIAYKPYAVGTIFVKEQFVLPGEHNLASSGIPKKPASIIVMIKEKPGYDPKGGDWQYLYFLSDGNIITQGKGTVQSVKTLCFDCHNNVKGRDFIFSRIIRHKQPQLK